jgi:hypothetical protein
MNYKTRETIRNEIKVLTFRRRISKNRSRMLQKEAGILFREVQADQAAGSLEDHYWKDDRWKAADTRASTAISLRASGASQARHLNIAYGLMRGMPYKAIEQKCRVAPSAATILSIMHEHLPYAERKEWDLDTVKALLQ